MPLIISDELLEKAGLTEREARIEFACRLFDADKIHLWPAAQLAGMSRDEFMSELFERKIPAFRPTIEDVRHDVRVMQEFQDRNKR